MAKIGFSKYHGTANDFIIIDQESTTSFDLSNTGLIREMCDRRTGIGADGLMLILDSKREDVDFEMAYYNADGNPSSMCGNGGRCITLAAAHRSLIFERARFLFDNDIYFSSFDPSKNWVSLKMQNVSRIESSGKDFILDTGSPHFVKFTDTNEIDVKKKGSEIRYSDRFSEKGINVNFVEFKDDAINVLTYERGVEDETYSCGTGTVAVALASAIHFNSSKNEQIISTPGGILKVYFNKSDNVFQDIWLEGPANFVFKGYLDVH